MADRIPSALEMRDLKYGDRPVEERDRVAALLRAEGRRAEALLLHHGRAQHPFVAEEARHAVEQGISFLLLQIRRMGGAVTDDMIRACAESAERHERWLDARQCWQALGDEAAIVRISPHLPPSLARTPEVPPPAPTTSTA